MKGCLKIRSRTPSPGQSRCSTPPTPATTCTKKVVAFTASIDAHDVHTADEWDRTPVEPAKPLSYEDILELKEIQNSLPRAQQRPDFYVSTRTTQYLLGVPVALLPIFSDNSRSKDPSPTTSSLSSPLSSGVSSPVRPSSPHSSSSSCTTATTTSSTTTTTTSVNWSTINFRAPNKNKPQLSSSQAFVPPTSHATPTATPWTPPHLAHLVPRSPIAPPAPSTPPRSPTPQRLKPTFSFLPLVDNPPPTLSRPPEAPSAPSTASLESPFLPLNAGLPTSPSSPHSGAAEPATVLCTASNESAKMPSQPNESLSTQTPTCTPPSHTASALAPSPFPYPRASCVTPSPPRRPTASLLGLSPTNRHGHHTDTDTETETETEPETDPPTPALTSRALSGPGVLGVDSPTRSTLHSLQPQQPGKLPESLLFGNPPGVFGLEGPGVPQRKRRFIVVNDMEVDLGNDDHVDEEEEQGEGCREEERVEDTALSEARAYNERMMRLYDC